MTIAKKIAKKIAKNNSNVDTANKNGYIFTTYSTRTGFDSNGYNNDVESIEIKCDTLGNADTFDGLYREVVFFDADHKDGWDIKTTDGKILAKGNTKDELRKAYDNLAKAEVTTATEEKTCIADIYYFGNDRNGNRFSGLESKDFNTTQQAAEWIIAFANEHPNYSITTNTNIHDFKAYKEYNFTDADIAALMPALFPAEDSDDDELIDPPTTTPADDFATKLAELKAKQDAAKEKELAAKKVYKEASDKYEECRAATQDFLDAHADKLTEKISALEIESRITMVRDNGKERYDLFDTSQLNVYAFNGFGKMFIVRCRGNELGTYDTPAQIEVVINQLKAAVERGDREFEFPTVEDLTIAEKIAAEKAEYEANQPAEVKAFNAELAASKLQAPTMWVKITDGKTGFHFGSFTRGVLSEVRVDYDAVNKYGVFYFDEPMRRYDTFAQVKTAIGQFKTAITNNAEEFTFPTIEELTTPEIDKDATADSLTRAMTIALEHYQDFCRIGNLTAATNELSLYNICRKAMTELLRRQAA